MDTSPTTHPDPTALASEGALQIPEAARWIGISRSSLYELIAAGELASCRIGRRRLVPRAALRAYLAARLAAGAERA